MNNYIELPVDSIELDISNPRIARGIAYYGENITSETMALLLGSTSEACASLRESIRENGGIIHPIVVNKRADGSHVVIEGNTRLQIYRLIVKSSWTLEKIHSDYFS
ncbi:MAG: ParB/Srx family N-terminal domain-containing protein, partial [Bacillota bacterium]|nr:ParB/Srx family N-terminal domain-containing protein [Bacillota bacterium]